MDTKKLPMGVVLPNLEAYRRLVHVLVDEPSIAHHEFTYRSPLYKFSPELVAALSSAKSAIEKFDLYFEKGILDETERVRLAQKFRAEYARKHPGSEGSDLFLASGDVLGFKVVMKPPTELDSRAEAIRTILSYPHDESVFRAIHDGERIAEEHLTADFRIFLDHVFNPRRRELAEVQAVMTGARRHEPVIVEMYSSGAIPGYFHHTVGGAIDEVDGALVWLPG